MRTFTKYLTPFLFAAATITMAHAEDVAIVGGDVYTADNNTVYMGGVVVIHDDKIMAVGGADTEVPEGYRVIDATGKWVTPGLMNVFTQIGVEEVSLEPSTLNGAVSETFYNAGFDVSDGINPMTTLIPVSRIEGLTRAVVAPTPAVPFSKSPNHSIFAGQAAIIKLSDGFDVITNQDAAELVYPGAGQVGDARGAVMAYLEGALAEANAYANPPKKKGKGSSNGGGGKFLKSQADKDAMARVIKGEEVFFVNEDHAPYILQLLKLKEKYKDMKLVILGGSEAWMVADQIAAAGVPVVIAPTENLPGSFDSLASTLYNGARLEKAGVDVIIVNGGFDTHNARLLPQDAGNAVANGMSWNAALNAITINPAKAFGIDDTFGSLTKGKDADVVVWDGDPLEVMSSPDHVFIQGTEVPLESRQTKLRDRYLTLDNPNEDPFAYRNK